jgi:hypothetical protein
LAPNPALGAKEQRKEDHPKRRVSVSLTTRKVLQERRKRDKTTKKTEKKKKSSDTRWKSLRRGREQQKPDAARLFPLFSLFALSFETRSRGSLSSPWKGEKKTLPNKGLLGPHTAHKTSVTWTTAKGVKQIERRSLFAPPLTPLWGLRVRQFQTRCCAHKRAFCSLFTRFLSFCAATSKWATVHFWARARKRGKIEKNRKDFLEAKREKKKEIP